MEACELSAVEARRLIGAKQLSSLELLESCIARIEAVDHAVNAMVARDFDRARVAATMADAAVARGDAVMKQNLHATWCSSRSSKPRSRSAHT